MTQQSAIAYERLTEHLKESASRELKMRFNEIEQVLQESFPASARKYNAWWSNNPSNNPRTFGWLNAGYITSSLNLADETVVFIKRA